MIQNYPCNNDAFILRDRHALRARDDVFRQDPLSLRYAYAKQSGEDHVSRHPATKQRDNPGRVTRDDDGAGGFTLIEILLVTMLLGILVSVATVQFRRSFDGLQFDNLKLDITSMLRYARDRAILEKTAYRVQYDQNRQGFKMEKASGAPKKGAWEFLPIRDRTGALRRVPAHIRADTTPDTAVFYPDGSSNEITWKFADPQDRTVTLRTAPECGDIRVEEPRD